MHLHAASCSFLNLRVGSSLIIQVKEEATLICNEKVLLSFQCLITLVCMYCNVSGIGSVIKFFTMVRRIMACNRVLKYETEPYTLNILATWYDHGLIYFASPYLPASIFMMLYNCLINSKLTYCIGAWGNEYNTNLE